MKFVMPCFIHTHLGRQDSSTDRFDLWLCLVSDGFLKDFREASLALRHPAGVVLAGSTLIIT